MQDTSAPLGASRCDHDQPDRNAFGRIRAGKAGELPNSILASVIGISGVTLALHAAEGQARWSHDASVAALSLTCAVFGGLAAIHVSKVIRHPNAVAKEWHCPVTLSVFSALMISLLLIATALNAVAPHIARLVWVVGALGQAGPTLAVLSDWIGYRPFPSVYISPAWFIPAIGTVVASFVVVPPVLMMNRLVFHDPLPGRMVPIRAILIAPPAVASLSWLQLDGGVLDSAARLFCGTAIVFTALALTQVAKLRGQGFALSWWGLSFPVAALTIATPRYGAVAGSPAHVGAGYLGLSVLIAVVIALVGLIPHAAARHEICHPE